MQELSMRIDQLSKAASPVDISDLTEEQLAELAAAIAGAIGPEGAAGLAGAIATLSEAQLQALADALAGAIGPAGAAGIAGAIAALPPEQLQVLAEQIVEALGTDELVDLVDRIGGLPPAQLLPLNIVSTLVDNGDGTYTYTDEAGVATTITPAPAVIDWANLSPFDVADLSQSIINADGIIQRDAFGNAIGVSLPIP